MKLQWIIILMIRRHNQSFHLESIQALADSDLISVSHVVSSDPEQILTLANSDLNLIRTMANSDLNLIRTLANSDLISQKNYWLIRTSILRGPN